jgi:anti-sigma factor RsiW
MSMASNCEDVSAQMMELLYGELPAEARANVDAHVAGCARCRSELEGFEKTRAVARQGLDEAPPARAHAAIMRAAAAHLAAQARPAARKPAAPEPVSFWDRVRARWAFPTLATVGAVAVFLIANRVFLNPERTLELHQAAEAPAAAPAEPAPVPAPELARKMAPAGGTDPAAKTPPVVEAIAEPPPPAPASPPAAAHRRRTGAWADPPPRDLKPTAETSASGRADDDRAFGKDADKRGDRPASKMKAKKMEEDVARFAPPPPAAKPEPVAGKVQDLEKRPFAAPPPPRESQAAKHKPTDKAPAALDEGYALDQAATKSAPAPRRSAPSAASPKGSLDNLMPTESARQGAGSAGGLGVVGGAAGPRKGDGLSGTAQAAPAPRPTVVQNQGAKRASPPPATASAPAPAATAPAMAASPPPPPAQPAQQQQSKNRLRRAESESASDEGAWAAESSDAKEEKKQSAGNKANANETLLQRADRLFAEGRWNEAAAAYRELLRREPHSGDADRWRRRLTVAENADVSERSAKAAKRARKAPAKAAADADSAAAQ